mgnify:CR=1 FL=1
MCAKQDPILFFGDPRLFKADVLDCTSLVLGRIRVHDMNGAVIPLQNRGVRKLIIAWIAGRRGPRRPILQVTLHPRFAIVHGKAGGQRIPILRPAILPCGWVINEHD